ncbi:Hypothetical predicted protein [Podarcis lilfordi]|uniref:Uncharacterized protein n=1 Tax=Podarcis lilfordi TaxID=74358 RepID=A0AA35LKE1_9SAUR|nr:Hypothetical predicted protein [Podarcis lilfordi]
MCVLSGEYFQPPPPRSTVCAFPSTFGGGIVCLQRQQRKGHPSEAFSHLSETTQAPRPALHGCKGQGGSGRNCSSCEWLCQIRARRTRQSSLPPPLPFCVFFPRNVILQFLDLGLALGLLPWEGCKRDVWQELFPLLPSVQVVLGTTAVASRVLSYIK